MSGASVVRPEDFRGEYNLMSLLRGSFAVEGELRKRMIEAAVGYLREAGICFPHATLEVRDNGVVMHGVPNGGELLVCAVECDGMHNHLGI